MKKGIFSIHKSFLNKQIINNKTDTMLSGPQGRLATSPSTVLVEIPGGVGLRVIKGGGVIKNKTDRGNQIITLSNYKKCFNNASINNLNNRLDLVLIYLKFSLSLKESKHIISQRKVKVNGIIITNYKHILKEYSIIECNYNNSKNNYLVHEISNTIITPTNLLRLNEKKQVYIIIIIYRAQE